MKGKINDCSRPEMSIKPDVPPSRQGGFGREEWRTAKKEHKCGECKRIIEVGDEYHYSVGYEVDEGFGDFKTCVRCMAAWTTLEECGFVVCYGTLFETLEEYNQEYGPQPTDFEDEDEQEEAVPDPNQTALFD